MFFSKSLISFNSDQKGFHFPQKVMKQFDKICAVLAIPLGLSFMVLGVVGLFAGSNFNFSLPPVIGALPFFAGWAMCVTLVRCWNITTKLEEHEEHKKDG
jgi:hypothetical protein